MSSTPPVTPLSPGDWVHRYELLYPVAQGGMGAVWAARLQSMNSFEKLFAVKLILAQYASHPEFRGMFLDEARIAAGIVHPNVAQVIDLGEQNGLLYIVMEWLDGDSLSVLHREATSRGELLPLGMVLRLTADACAGLHAAHELRDHEGALLDVVHRDISPHNLFVTGGGTVKIIDFGIAKARHRINETTAGVLKGKIHYMAPEQASGLEIDRRADLWSVGAMLYYFTTGRYAYDGPNEVATLHALMSPKGRAPIPASVPKAVAAIIDRAMSFDPPARYATALEMKTAIESAMDELGLKVTAATVEAHCRERLAPRFEARKQSLGLGKRAAEERRRMRQMLEERAMVESGSSSHVEKDALRARLRASNPPARVAAASVPTVTAAPEIDAPASAALGIDETLASGVLTAASPPAARTRHRAIGAGAVALVAATVITLAVRGRSDSQAPVASGRPSADVVDVLDSATAPVPPTMAKDDEPAVVAATPATTSPSDIAAPTSSSKNSRTPHRAPSRHPAPPAPKRAVTDTAIQDRK